MDSVPKLADPLELDARRVYVARPAIRDPSKLVTRSIRSCCCCNNRALTLSWAVVNA